MSEYNTLDKFALDRWITREPDCLDDEEEIPGEYDEETEREHREEDAISNSEDRRMV